MTPEGLKLQQNEVEQINKSKKYALNTYDLLGKIIFKIIYDL